MLEIFHNKSLRSILHIYWSNKISIAEELHERTGMLPNSVEVKRRCRWIGHVNTIPLTKIYKINTKMAMCCTPVGRNMTTERHMDEIRGARNKGSPLELVSNIIDMGKQQHTWRL